MPDACEAVLAQRSSKEKEEVGPVGFEPTTPGLKVSIYAYLLRLASLSLSATHGLIDRSMRYRQLV